jgi:transcriptional regulator with XRE-family HTH domain
MNQQALANALDLTFQQVQKYEHGANRVSASRLAAMAKILVVPISYFFADLQSDGAELSVEDKMWREQLQRPETIESFEEGEFEGDSRRKKRRHRSACTGPTRSNSARRNRRSRENPNCRAA